MTCCVHFFPNNIAINNQAFLLRLLGGVVFVRNGFASLLLSSLAQNGRPETSGSQYQRSSVRLASHSRGHGEGFTSETPRSAEGRAKTELIQTATDGHCQERFIWEGISHTSAHACLCVCMSVCESVDKMKENRWEEAQFARVWGRE